MICMNTFEERVRIRLGHVELVVTDLAAARSFYVDGVGLIEHQSDDRSCHLRAADEFDAWSLALTEGAHAGLGHIAFRVEHPGGLDVLERAHSDRGLPVARVPAGLEPGQGQALRVTSGSGHPIEFYFDFDEIPVPDPPGLPLPMRATHLHAPDGAVRLDHVNLRATDIPASLDYWQGMLGLRPSEHWLQPDGSIRVAWLRGSASKSHDVAVGPSSTPGLHHVAYSVGSDIALIRLADRLADSGWVSTREYGPSRHGATNALCMYLRDPSGHRLELYTGDYVRDLDRPPIVWTAEAYASRGHSWWGQPAPPSFQEYSDIVVGEPSIA